MSILCCNQFLRSYTDTSELQDKRQTSDTARTGGNFEAGEYIIDRPSVPVPRLIWLGCSFDFRTISIRSHICPNAVQIGIDGLVFGVLVLGSFGAFAYRNLKK